MEYLIFTVLGIAIGFGLVLFIGFKYGKKKPNARDVLAQELDEFFSNTQRNTLADLRRLNPERCKAFGHSVQEMHVTFWTTAISGETGELCNWVKKMVRGDKIENLQTIFAKEAADIVIYTDLFCTHMGINLEDAIIQKFNEVSDRVNSPIKLK